MYPENSAQAAAAQVARNKQMPSSKARPEILTLLAKLDVSNNNYVLSFKHEQQQKISKITKGLLDRDGFIATHMKVGILPVKVASSIEYFTAQAAVYWPDPTVFNTAAGAAALSEAEALESIYWGNFSIETNEDKRLERHSLCDFRVVQQTQASASTKNMQTGLEWVSLKAAFRIAGGDENDVNVSIDCLDKTHLAGAAARNNYLLIGFKGSIIKGVTTKAFLSGGSF